MKCAKSIIFFLTIATAMGCGKKSGLSFREGGESSNSSEKNLIDLPVPGVPGVPSNPNFSGVLLYQRHCAACHSDIASTSKRNRTTAQITEAVGAILQMRSLNTLTTQEVSSIAEALSGTTPAPGAPATGTAADGDFFAASIGTRDYVKSTLRDFFITDATSAGDLEILRIINTRIHRNPAAFGGPCSKYDGIAFCENDARAAGLTMSPRSSVIRKGLTSQACEEILARQTVTAVRGVLSKVALTETARADQVAINKVFDIFYPGRPPNTEVTAALIDLDNAAIAIPLSDLNRWRHVLLPLCQSALAEIL